MTWNLIKKTVFFVVCCALCSVCSLLVSSNKLLAVKDEIILAQRDQLQATLASCGIKHNLNQEYKRNLEEMRVLLGIYPFDPKKDYEQEEQQHQHATGPK